MEKHFLETLKLESTNFDQLHKGHLQATEERLQDMETRSASRQEESEKQLGEKHDASAKILKDQADKSAAEVKQIADEGIEQVRKTQQQGMSQVKDTISMAIGEFEQNMPALILQTTRGSLERNQRSYIDSQSLTQVER